VTISVKDTNNVTPVPIKKAQEKWICE